MAKILYCLSSGEKLLFDNNALFLEKELIADFRFSLPSYKRLLSKCRLANRFFRLEPRVATFIDEDIFVVSFLQKLYFISVRNKKILDIVPVRKGFSNILNFCSLKKYGSEKVYWGDYGMNISMEEINIYSYSLSEGIKVCHTFDAGTIKHIHNILYDRYRDRFFIFTGDLGDFAGIYTASRDFSQVSPFLVGDERYRAVIGRVTEAGLFWATDAVMNDNYVLYVSFNTGAVSELSELNGSVIYGVGIGGGLVVSTTVESYPLKKSKLLTFLDNRRAPGIKSNYVDVLFISDDLSITKIAKFQKDWLPMRLFQYGHVAFPYYEDDYSSEVICNPVAVKRWDGKKYIINLNRL